MKFDSAQHMLDYITAGNDIYSPTAYIYVFLYNDQGSICEYAMSPKYAQGIANYSRELGEYWGAILGRGWNIIDSLEYMEANYTDDDYVFEDEYQPIDFCNDYWQQEWVDCKSYGLKD